MPRSKKIETYPAVWWDLVEVMGKGHEKIEVAFETEAQAENKRQEFYAFMEALHYSYAKRTDFPSDKKVQYYNFYIQVSQYVAQREENVLRFALRCRSAANLKFAAGLAAYVSTKKQIDEDEGETTAMDKATRRIFDQED